MSWELSRTRPPTFGSGRFPWPTSSSRAAEMRKKHGAPSLAKLRLSLVFFGMTLLSGMGAPFPLCPSRSGVEVDSVDLLGVLSLLRVWNLQTGWSLRQQASNLESFFVEVHSSADEPREKKDQEHHCHLRGLLLLVRLDCGHLAGHGRHGTSAKTEPPETSSPRLQGLFASKENLAESV